MGPLFKMYADYCMNYHKSDVLVRQMEKDAHPFIPFYQKQLLANAPPSYKKFKISAFLITPVQRLPRYKMLLTDLLKYTPACHPDHENVKVALKLITDVTITVNNNTKKLEMFEKMKDYQQSITGLPDEFKINNGSRELVGEVKALQIKKKNVKPVDIILFNDIVLFCEFSDKGVFSKTQRKKLSYEVHLKLLGMKLKTVKESDIEAKSVTADTCFSLEVQKQSFVLSFVSAEDKQKWQTIFSTEIEKENHKMQMFEARAKTAALEKAEMARNLIQGKFNSINQPSLKTRRWKDRGTSVATLSYAEKWRLAEEIKQNLGAPQDE
ncbi:Spermatogenesis-associated protein [Entamoeba marina]